MGRRLFLIAALIAVPLLLWWVTSQPAVVVPRARVSRPQVAPPPDVADAGTTALTPTAEPLRGETFEGVVLDADGGAINCAVVSWPASLRGHVLTGADGRFTIAAGETPAPKQLQVMADGYADLTAEVTRPLQLTMTPLPRYVGKVIDEHGRAVEHFTVDAVSFAGGRFDIPIVAPTFKVTIAAPGFIPAVATIDPADPDHVFELDTGEPRDIVEAFRADAGLRTFPPGSDAARCPWLLRRFN